MKAMIDAAGDDGIVGEEHVAIFKRKIQEDLEQRKRRRLELGISEWCSFSLVFHIHLSHAHKWGHLKKFTEALICLNFLSWHLNRYSSLMFF